MNRKEYIDQAAKRSKDLSERIDQLITKANKTKEQVENDFKSQVETLELRKERINAKLEVLKNVSEDEWEGARQDFESAAEESFIDQFKNMMGDMSERVGEVADWAEGHFESFYEKASAKVKEWTEKIQHLEKNAEEKSKDAVKEELDNLKEKRDNLGKQLSELSSSSGEAWGDVKKGFIEAGASLRDAFRSAFRKF